MERPNSMKILTEIKIPRISGKQRARKHHEALLAAKTVELLKKQDRFEEITIAKSTVEKWQKHTDAKLKLQKVQNALFRPLDPFILWWNIANTVIMIYILIDIPVGLVFEGNDDLLSPASFIDILVDIFFVFDIAINFRTAFVQGQNLIMNSRQIAIHYAKGWFFIDLITTIPFDLLMSILHASVSKLAAMPRLIRLMKIFRLLKLVRIAKIMKTMGEWGRQDGFSLTLSRALKFVVVVFAIAHMSACGWKGVTIPYLSTDGSYDAKTWISRYGAEDRSNGQLYLICLYWAFTTLCTVGYGDITAGTPLEYAYAICIMVVGSSLFGFIVGNIASLVKHEDDTDILIRKKISAVSAYMRYRQLPEEMQQRIQHHYEFSWKQTQVYDEEQILSELPPTIRTDVALFIHKGTISQVGFLKELGSDVVPMIVTKLRPALAAPLEIIIKEGFYGREMYLCMAGLLASYIGGDSGHAVDILAKEIPIRKIVSGQEFAEYALLFKVIKHPTSVKALCFCDLFILHKVDFDDIGKLFPPAVQSVREFGMKRFKHLLEELRCKQSEPKNIELASTSIDSASLANCIADRVHRKRSSESVQGKHTSIRVRRKSSLNRSSTMSKAALAFKLQASLQSKKQRKQSVRGTKQQGLNDIERSRRSANSREASAHSRGSLRTSMKYVSQRPSGSARKSMHRASTCEDDEQEENERNKELLRIITQAFQKKKHWTSTDDFTPNLKNKIKIWKTRAQMSLAIRRLEASIVAESQPNPRIAALKSVGKMAGKLVRGQTGIRNASLTDTSSVQVNNPPTPNSVGLTNDQIGEWLSNFEQQMVKMEASNLAHFERIEATIASVYKLLDKTTNLSENQYCTNSNDKTQYQETKRPSHNNICDILYLDDKDKSNAENAVLCLKTNKELPHSKNDTICHVRTNSWFHY